MLRTTRSPRVPRFFGLTFALVLTSHTAALAASFCAVERTEPLQPTNLALCGELAATVRQPRSLPLDAYQAKLAEFLRNFCHRDAASGWQRDKRGRDTGPFFGTLVKGKWESSYQGTHAPVVVWYSPEMLAWLKANRAQT